MRASLDGRRPSGIFPREDTYPVGRCASGRIPFPSGQDLDEVTYANSLGDKAIWDAERLDQPPTTSRDNPPPRPQGIGEGTFVVGDDIHPGRYKARAKPGDSCYWARLKDDSGELDSIIANNLTDGAASVTIKASDGAFETRGCTPWIRQP